MPGSPPRGAGSGRSAAPDPDFVPVTKDPLATRRFEERDLLMAAEEGDLTRVLIILKEHPEEVDRPDEWGCTALHKAASTGKLPVVEVLLVFKADVNARNRNGSTPLHRAAMYGRAEVAEHLIKHHADVNAMNNSGTTPLHRAASTGKTALVELLCKAGANPVTHTMEGELPIDLAHAYGHGEVARVLQSYTPKK